MTFCKRKEKACVEAERFEEAWMPSGLSSPLAPSLYSLRIRSLREVNTVFIGYEVRMIIRFHGNRFSEIIPTFSHTLSILL